MIKDVRVTPYPVGANVISTPGETFKGHLLSIELHDGVSHGVVIPRGADTIRVAKLLRHLATEVEGKDV